MRPSRAREVVVVLVHLALWSQLGVLTRIYLVKFFSDGCKGAWGLCLVSDGSGPNSLGAYFPDLVSNMLGSFFMGLFAAASTLGLPGKKAMAILPPDSPWQHVPELHIGLRTGFCGSLTTFASWEYSLITSLIGGQGKQGGQWAEFLWGPVVGLELALASYAFGEQCALIVDRYLVAGGREETSLEGRQALERASMDAVQTGELGGPAQGLDLDDWGGMVTLREQMDAEVATLSADEVLAAAQSHAEAARDGAQPVAAPGGGVRGQNGPAAAGAAGSGKSTNGQRKAENGRGGSARNGDAGKGGGKAGDGGAAEHGAREPWLRNFLRQHPDKYVLHRRTNIGTLLALAAVLALFICFAVLDRRPVHKSRRAQWFAVLLGPAGCSLRWYLSQFNYKLPGRWKWLPCGTFAANMMACIVDYIVGGISERVGGLGYWAFIILYAIRTGFSGALSTVSTFVAEIKGQLQLVPEVLHGYVYAIGSLAAGSVLGVLIYGSMVWAP